jgi:hypothetical protein
MGYIFEAEIDAIIHAVRIKTIGEDDGIVLKKILSANIHPAVKAYFRAEVEKTLLQERGLEYRSKKIPYSLPEIRSLEEQIDLLLVQNYHFSQHEFESLLDESVHFQFNYLCRPQWTLQNFIIGEQRRVSTTTIEKRLKYCVDYMYFPELIKRYIVDHGLAEVTYEEFKSLIEKIDREVVAQHSSAELANMTRALFDFVESGKMVPKEEFEQQSLPINAAIVFFEDKQLDDIRIRLEFERDRNRLLQITSDRLAEIIEIVRTGNEDTIVDVDLQQVINQSEEQIEDEAALSIPAPQNEVEAEVNEEKIPEALAVQLSPQTKSAPLVFGENDEKYLASMPSMRQKEILNLFSESERSIIIGKLFGDDEPAFLAAATEISLQHSWDQVAVYLDTLFLADDVDPFCTEAVLFTDKLFAHFHQIEKKK